MLGRNLLTGFAATVALLSASAASAQNYGWHEDFGHNNAGLYTNLNGGPNNLTIENGIASFSGVEGTYYGRTDLLIPEFAHSEWHFVWSFGGVVQNSGPIGFGWHSPVQNSGMSVLLDQDTLSFSLIQHQGFNNATVLESVAYEAPIWGNGGQPEEPLLYFNYDETAGGWGASVLAGDPFKWYDTQVHAGITPTADMHFLMYGWESAKFGPGVLDRFGTSSVPEPAMIFVLALGVGSLAVRWRQRRA